MAQSDALWNEVCRILNKEFFDNGQPITPVLLIQCITLVKEMLDE